MNCRSSRKSLDYSKQSLRISIDLGKREEESETWLQVGRIYYLIQEDELADMYLQVRSREYEGEEHFQALFILLHFLILPFAPSLNRKKAPISDHLITFLEINLHDLQKTSGANTDITHSLFH